MFDFNFACQADHKIKKKGGIFPELCFDRSVLSFPGKAAKRRAGVSLLGAIRCV